MSKDTKIIIAVILFVAILLVAVGFAAITTVNLNIEGTAQAETSDANFTVKFTGDKETSGDGTITANVTDEKNATFNVTGLTTKGQTATVTYTVQNTSADLGAKLSVNTAAGTNSNKDFYQISTAIAETGTLAAGGTTTVTVNVKLLKTPALETAEELKATFGVQIDAVPVQQ